MNKELVSLVSEMLAYFCGTVGVLTFIGGLVTLGFSYGSQDPGKQDLAYKLIAAGVIGVSLAFVLPAVLTRLFNIIPTIKGSTLKQP